MLSCGVFFYMIIKNLKIYFYSTFGLNLVFPWGGCQELPLFISTVLMPGKIFLFGLRLPPLNGMRLAGGTHPGSGLWLWDDRWSASCATSPCVPSVWGAWRVRAVRPQGHRQAPFGRRPVRKRPVLRRSDLLGEEDNATSRGGSSGW